MADAVKKVVKMKISPKAKKVVEEKADELDMKEQGILSRLVEWFGAQDDATQKHVLNLLPTGQEAEILRRAADRLEAQRKAKG